MRIVLEFEGYEAMSGYLETPPEPSLAVGDEFTMRVKVLDIDGDSDVPQGGDSYWTVSLGAAGPLVDTEEGTYIQATLEKADTP